MTRPGHAPSDLPSYTGTLTPEHLAVIHAERDRWLRIGLSTTPADRPAAEAAVRRAYQAARLQSPSLVVWMDSPLGGCLATATLQQFRGRPGDRFGDQLGHELRHRLGGQLSDALWRHLYDQLQGQLGRELLRRLGDRRGQPQGEIVDGQLLDQLWGQLQGQLGGQLWGQLQGQLGDQFTIQLQGQSGQLSVPLARQLQGQLGDQLGGQPRGQLDHWEEPVLLAKWRCALRIAGLEPAPWLEALADAVTSLGMWWPLRGAVVLTDRPTILARDEYGRLHAEHGPALAWADGYGLHALRGVRVPAHVIEAPETITVDHIRGERNVEVRRVLLERYGHQRYLRDAGAEHVHTDDTGTLWRCRLRGDEPLMMVEVVNATPEPDGSARTYWLRVPPAMRTARQAVAWTFNLDEGDYQPQAQS
jgi:hypothetical protein